MKKKKYKEIEIHEKFEALLNSEVRGLYFGQMNRVHALFIKLDFA